MDKDNCETIREWLAEDGLEAAGLPEVASHLEGCADCTSFLAALRRVEAGLRDVAMPDATDALAADTLRAVRRVARDGGVGDGGAPARPGDRDRWLAAGLAASVLIATGVGLNSGFDALSYMKATVNRTLLASFDELLYVETQVTRGPVAETESSASRRGDAAQPKSNAGGPVASPPAEKKQVTDDLRRGREAGGVAGAPAETPTEKEFGRERDIIALLDAEDRHRQTGQRGALNRLERETESTALLEPDGQLRAPRAGAKTKDAAGQGEGSESYGFYAPPKNESARRNKSVQTLGESSLDPSAPTPDESSRDQVAAVTSGNKRPLAKLQPELGLASDPDRSAAPVGGGWDDAALSSYEKRRNLAPAADWDRALAAAFLERQRSLDGLSFQEPVGYWANTYIPGDPAMRLLGAQLRGWNRAMFGPRSGFEREVRPVRQPFDAPRDAALAVYLHADAPAIDGPTRLRVQVGLKGADRQGGRRPAMNVGLVLDLRGVVDAGAGARIRALISALERARQPEDRFSLTVAGPGGGLVAAPERFRHGPLRVAMDRLFGAGRDAGRPAVGLQEAVGMAAESVRRGDDPGAVLGSSLVILVTGSSLADDLEALVEMAHRNAVGGLPLSVIGLAAREDPRHVERLVAAGQGNRRILDSARAADGLIDRELHAASRAVARAVRLRIRLAPGVRLVDVLGSRRLAEPQAERVREAEQSIDRRLARNFGIQADRGEDEEGLQIVIPTFQAGDDHVILLDVVVDKAGPVADVTARYKDVIHLKNGVARASLTVGRGASVAGPLELNVLKNLVAREYALRTGEAARYLAAGDPRRASATIMALRDLIRGLRAEVAGWRSDPDLAADETLLNDYLAALASPAVADSGQRQYVAASLRYAAFRKLQPAAR